MAIESGTINVSLHSCLPEVKERESVLWLSAQAGQLRVSLFMAPSQMLALAHNILQQLDPPKGTAEVTGLDGPYGVIDRQIGLHMDPRSGRHATCEDKDVPSALSGAYDAFQSQYGYTPDRENIYYECGYSDGVFVARAFDLKRRDDATS